MVFVIWTSSGKLHAIQQLIQVFPRNFLVIIISNKKHKINNVEMEGVKTALAGAGSCVLCLIGTACSILPIVYIVYLGIYAFNNPDAESWYGLDANGK